MKPVKTFTAFSLLMLIFFMPFKTMAQAGANDPTFNPTDIGFGKGDGPNQTVLTTAIQSDGKIIIGGAFTAYNGTTINRIARLNTDGTLDGTFVPSGTGLNNTVNTIAIQSDGKIIVGGTFTSYDITTTNRIVRLNTNGTLDGTFVPTGAGLNNSVNTIAIQSDGKIIIGGAFTSYNGTTINRITRLNSDGTLDGTFNAGGTGATNQIQKITIQSDGKIIVGGVLFSYNGSSTNLIRRLNDDGTIDGTFTPATSPVGQVQSTAIQSDGKIIIGGQFSFDGGSTFKNISRLNTDGSVDGAFNPGGAGANNQVQTTALQIDGKIIFGGLFTSYNGTTINRIARLNSDGSIDGTFNPAGNGADNTVQTSALQSDGKIIMGGAFLNYNGISRRIIVRLNTDGTLDLAFNPGTGANGQIMASAVQSDDKIIIGGLFTSFNGITRNFIARLDADGLLDVTFAPTGAGLNSSVNSIAIQSDGKIIIGGNFTSYNGTTINRIARLNADGTLDGTFNLGGTGAINTAGGTSVFSTALQTDGKIIITGTFNTYNGTPTDSIARLNVNGTLDGTFVLTGTGISGSPTRTAIQSDGKIIVGGSFTSYNGTTTNRIARLNDDGSLDGTFAPTGTGLSGTVNAIAIQSDGKIIVGGAFATYNGITQNLVARLNADGTLDGTFNQVTASNIALATISIQSDGKIIIGGSFLSYNGTSITRIARLNTDGSLDVTFNTGTGANSVVSTTAIQSDGKIIIAGNFISYNGTGRNRIARIIGSNCTPPEINCPENITVSNDEGQCGANVSFAATATGTSPIISYSQNPGTFFPVGTTTVTATATNSCGAPSCTFTITVNDTEKPVLLPAVSPTLTVQCNAVPIPLVLEATDNCPGVSVVSFNSVRTNGNCSDNYTLTYTWSATDAHNNTETQTQIITVKDDTKPIFTRPPDIVIPFTSTCGYNASVANTGDVTNETDNCSTGLQATFTDVNVWCGNTFVITRTWHLVDNCGNSATDQDQTITVADNNTTYIIYATKEAKFGENNYINGDVGVTDAHGKAEFKKGDVLNPYVVRARNITVQLPSSVTNKVFSPATGGPNPPFQMYVTNPLSGDHNQTTNGVVPAGNYKNLTIKKGIIATVNGSNYGKITIEEGASVTFTSTNINIKELTVGKGKKGMAITTVYFSSCTAVKIKDRVIIEENTRVNVGGPKVTFYLSDAKKGEENFTVKGDDTEVTLNIMIPNGKLRVSGGVDNCVMTGWFIIEKLESVGKNIYWNGYGCEVLLARLVTKITSDNVKENSVSKEEPFTVKVSPNPTASEFNIRVISNSNKLVSIRIMDLSGKVLEVKSGISRESTMTVGGNLIGGTYFAEVMQGTNRKVVKLIKLN